MGTFNLDARLRSNIIPTSTYQTCCIIAIKDWLQNFGKSREKAIEPNSDEFPVLFWFDGKNFRPFRTPTAMSTQKIESVCLRPWRFIVHARVQRDQVFAAPTLGEVVQHALQCNLRFLDC